MAELVASLAEPDGSDRRDNLVIRSTELAFVRFIQRIGLGAAPILVIVALVNANRALAFVAALLALSGAMAFLQVRAGRPRADLLMLVVVTLAAAQSFTLRDSALEALWVAVAALGAIGGAFVMPGKRWRFHGYIGFLLMIHLIFDNHNDELLFTAVQLAVYLVIAVGLSLTLQDLVATEDRYENVFGRTPISMWQEDFSAVARWIEDLRSEGVEDLEAHLAAHPDLIREVFVLITVTNVNDATVQMLRGNSRDQFIGPLLIEYYRPETYHSLVAQLLGIWNREGSVSTEMAGRTLDGDPIDCVLYWSTPRSRGEFDYSKVVISLIDVSPLKASEREARTQLKLAKQERRLQIMAANAADLLFVVSGEGAITWVSASVERLLGYELSDTVGRPFFDFIHHDDAEAVIGIGMALEPGVASGFILHRVRHRDGTWRTFEATARNMMDDEFVEGYVISSRDVTDRVHAEEALRDSESRFRLLAENASDIISSHLPTGEYVYVSPASELLMGRSPESLVGTNPLDLVHPDDQERMMDTHRQAFTCGGEAVLSVDYRMQHSDGSWRWFDTEIKAILEPGTDRVQALHASTRDVSDRKDTTEELTEAKMIAETATAVKSQFLANVSHEIRTPMNAILGMTELALGTEVSAEQREYLLTTRSAIDALITLVNDLLDIAKIEAGKLELEAIPFELSDTISDTLRALAVRAAEKGLALSHEMAADVPDAVVGDPGRLRQVLFNLIGNALKFTHAGSVRLGVEVVEQTDEAVELHLWVTDTGIGIPAEGLESIFEAFTQAEGSTTRRFGGTGLGLSISMQLVKLMEGKLWVESELGVGSTFHFTVRLAPASAEWAAESQDSSTATTVLVIADSEDARRGTTELLRLGGLHTVVASDLAGALNVVFEAGLNHPNPGAVIIDVRTGTSELARRLVNEPSFNNLPIVVVAPTGERGDAALYRSSGVAGYLSKPVSPGELADVIAAVSGGARADGELVTRHWLRARRPRMNLLVADDSATNRILATRLLEKRGHTVTVVETGREALELVLAVQFDAILMDVQMPDMDGLEATAAIRERETGRIPIIGLTAHAGEADRRRCLDAGMDGFVSKPFRPEELFTAVEQVFRGLVPGDAIPKPESRPADILDRFEALERLGGLPDLAMELMQEFQKEYPSDLQLIRDAFEAGDLEQVSRVAHRMKGGLGLLSAHPAAQAAALLERHAKEGTAANSATAWNVLQEEMERLGPVIVTLAGSATAWA